MQNYEKIHDTGHLVANELPVTIKVKYMLDFLQIDFECSRNDLNSTIISDQLAQSLMCQRNPVLIGIFTLAEEDDM